MLPPIVRNSWIYTLTELSASIIGAAVFIIAGRYLGPVNIGIYSFGLTVGMIGAQIINFGFDKLIMRDVSRNKDLAGDYFNRTFVLKTFITLVLLLLLVVLVLILDYTRLKSVVVIIASATVFVYSYISWLSSFIRAFQKAEYEAYIRISLRILNFAGGLFVLLTGWRLIGFSLSQVISASFVFTVGFFVVKNIFIKLPLSPKLSQSSNMLKIALPFMLLSMVSLLTYHVGTLMLNLIKGDYPTGIFSMANKLPQTLMFFPAALTSAFLPAISRYYAESGTGQEFSTTIRYALKFMTLIGFPATVAFIMLPEQICVLIFGESFRESGIPLMFLGISLTFSFNNAILAHSFIAMGREKFILLINTFGVILIIMLNLILISAYSYIGAALSIAAAEFLKLIVYFVKLHIRVKISSRIVSALIKPLIAAALMAFSINLISSFLGVILALLTGGMIYIITLFITKAFDSREIAIIKNLAGIKTAGDDQ